MDEHIDTGEIVLKAVKRCEKKGLNPVIRDIKKVQRWEIRKQGNYTVALFKVKGEIFVGVTKRKPDDKQNWNRAKAICIWRAVEDSCVIQVGIKE